MNTPRTLREILAGVPDVTLSGDPGRRIASVVLDSRQVRPGALFAALPGAHVDGARFIPQAIAAGAAAILTAGGPPGETESTAAPAWIDASNPRLALGLMARNFRGHPDTGLTVVGITGTNGKSTVAHLVAEILKQSGRPAGMLGTVTYRIGDREIPADRTTPEATDLYRMLEEMTAAGCRDAVLEISSHALALERVAGLSVSVAVFTNLTRDHLDFHGDLDSYAATKRRLFSERLQENGAAIAGADDPRASMMLDAAPAAARRFRFGFADGSDVRIESFHAGFEATDIRLRLPDGSVFEARTPLPGRIGALNISAAVLVAHALGLDARRAAEIAATFPGVPGRFERVSRGQDFAVIVDYAHSDDALENLMTSLREMQPRRVITVFGCGGDRDRSKRAPMGAAAMRHSDLVFLTSDNPRSEDPLAILKDAEAGIRAVPKSSGRYRVLPDRREAIHAAIASAATGDAVVIAGKGHETYQILGDRTIPFDDREVAAQALEVRVGHTV